MMKHAMTGGLGVKMRVRETSWEEFVAEVKGRNQNIVLYGAGVIGKITLPAFIEAYQLASHVLFAVDGDLHKSGGALRIGFRDIEIRPPETMEGMIEPFVILITGSRYGNILRCLEGIEAASGADVYIFPQMLVRKCRSFEKIEIRKKSEQRMIPKVIHYCWFGKGEMPDGLKRCRESWGKFCPDYQIIEWNEENYDVSRHAYTREAYRHKKWGFIPDIARLEILYGNGGIYLDTDVELIRELDDLLYQPGFVGVEKWGVVNIGGGCGVIPNHPMIGEILEYRLAFPFERGDGSLNLESSGSYETKPLMNWGFRPDNTVQTVGGMTVYTSDFFHPFDYMSKELCITENTYGIHRFTGSWV